MASMPGNREPEEDSGLEEEEENPFGQEEVFPSIPADGEDSDEPPILHGDKYANYIPEDAVIEHDFEAPGDFKAPVKTGDDWVQAEEEESAELASEEGAGGAPVPGEGSAAGAVAQDQAQPASDYQASQLDKMFPDDGFEQKGKLDWGEEGRTEAVPSPASQPAPPFEREAQAPETPPSRKETLSPEVAQLIERTSKRKPAAADGEKPQKAPAKGIFAVIGVAVVLLVVLAVVAAYQSKRAGEAHEQLSSAKANIAQDQAKLQEGFDKKIAELQTEKQDVQRKADKAAEQFATYKEAAEGKLTELQSLRATKKQLELLLDQLKEENAEFRKIEEELRLKKAQVNSLNSENESIKKQRTELQKQLKTRNATIKQMETDLTNSKSLANSLQKQLDELASSKLGPNVSLSELVKLRDSVRVKDIEIASLKELTDELDKQLKLMQEGGTGQINTLRMELANARRKIIEKDEELKKAKLAATRYSSPENTIVNWVEDLASGELERVIEHYAKNNVLRRKFDADGAEREELARQYKEFSAYRIEPEVLSITINPQEGTATAKLNLKLTADGQSRVVKATMLLARESGRWRIIDEGF